MKNKQAPYYRPLVSKWRPRFQKPQTCSRHAKNVFARIFARFDKFDLDPVTLTFKVKVNVTLPPETFQTKKRSSTYPIPLRRYKHLKFSIHKLIDIVGGLRTWRFSAVANVLFERGANFSAMILEFVMILFPDFFSCKSTPSQLFIVKKNGKLNDQIFRYQGANFDDMRIQTIFSQKSMFVKV